MNAIKRSILILTICLLVCPLGCSKKTSDGPVKAEYYPDCHEPLAYLRDRSSGVGKRVAVGAAKGGVISGIATVIASAITGNLRGVGVLAGVAAGAAVGGVVSGVSSSDEIEKEDNKRMSKYLEEIDGDIDGMDLTTASATVSRQCYNRAFDALKTDLREKKISVAVARSRLNEILAGENEAAQLLKEQPQDRIMEDEFESAIRASDKTSAR